MNRLITVVLVLGLASCTSAPHAQNSESDETAIREQLKGWEAAWNRGDAEAVASYYDEDADRTFAHGVVTTGSAAIREMYEKNLGAPLPEGVEQMLSLRVLSIRVISTDVAVADYEYRATGLPIAADLVINGRSTVVMLRRNGTWLRTAQRNWIPTTPECIRLCQESLSDYRPKARQ